MSRLIIALLISLFLSLAFMSNVFAERAAEYEMRNVAENWLTDIVHKTGDWGGKTNPKILSSFEVRSDDGLLMARIYNIDPKGFIAVPVLKEMPPVKMYSDKSNLDESHTGGPLQLLKDVLLSRLKAYEAIYGSLDASQPTSGAVMFGQSHRLAWDRLAVDKKHFESTKSLGTLTEGKLPLESSWHQGAPYNNSCPLDPFGSGENCLVGCVATAAAQIMKYWEWPPYGTDEECSYNWDITSHVNSQNKCVYTSKDGEVLSVDVSDGYDWANIPSNCEGGCSSEEDAALAELNYEVGVAFSMYYGYCQSGAYTSDAATVFPTYFRYRNTTSVEYRKDNTLQEWYDLIKDEIDAGRPMQYNISWPGSGHSIVCDGYRQDGELFEYHMNYGWGRSNTTTWYILDDINASIAENHFLVAGIEPEYNITPPYCVSFNVDLIPSTDIRIVFSEELDDASIISSNIVILGTISGTHDSWSFSQFVTPNSNVTPPTYTLVINPDDDFAFGENVTVTVGTGVTDLAGNPLETECSFDFEIGTCPQFLVTSWAGMNGSISPSNPFWVCQGDDTEFTATPNSDYEVDKWFVNGIERPFGGTKFTVYDIQSSVTVGVWFKAKPEPSGITVLSPNGGEQYAVDGIDMPIIWTSTGDIGNQVKIELWRDGGFERLVKESVYNDGSTSWGIPWDVPTGGCYKIRIASVDYPSVWDESDDCFEIVDTIVILDTIKIYTIEDLQAIGSDGAHPSDALYKLMNDINAAGFDFHPIGTGPEDYFRGTLDGNGFTVTQLENLHPSMDFVGLFSETHQFAVIKNLNLAEDCFTEGNEYVGAFAGRNKGRIINCTLKGIDNEVEVKGHRYVGGIAGENQGEIGNCSDSGMNMLVWADNRVGGIAGHNRGVIAYSQVDCQIRGEDEDSHVGGISGVNDSLIAECAFAGNIIANDWNGGIVAANNGSIENCFFVGYFTYGYRNGGIVGLNSGIVDKCYVASSGFFDGAISSRNNAPGVLSNCFWDQSLTEVNVPDYDGSGTILNTHPESTAEMYKQATFTTKYGTNWDFDNVWVINENVSYPRLRGIGDSLSAPDNVVASSDQSDGVHVSWDVVTFDIGGDIYAAVYRVYRSDSPDANPPETEVTGWQTGHTLVDTIAVPEATYYYWVRAAAGMNGIRSSELGGPAQGQRTYPIADTPTGILASDSLPHSILIEWDEASVANFYHVYRSISVSGSKTPLGSWQTGLSYSDTLPYPDTVYYYWVRAAMDDAGGYISDYGGPDSGYYIEPDDNAPTVSISMVPAYPIETQSCTLHVSAADNEVLGYVTLHWSANGVQDSVTWDNIGAQTLDTSHIIGPFSASNTIACWARAFDVSDNSDESQHITIVVLPEAVSQPSHPQGPVYLQADSLGVYTTEGSTTNLSSAVEYRFDWGWADSISSWGDGTDSMAWPSDGAYLIKSQARSLTNTNRVSVLSASLVVIVDSQSPVVTVTTNDGADITITEDSITISGNTRDDEPSSGVASTLINTDDTNEGDAYNWSFHVVSLAQGSNEIVITSTDNSGNESSNTINVTYSPVSVDDPSEMTIPDDFALNQNYPNPFNPSTVIEFDLPRRSHVEVSIYNLLGQKVTELVDQEYPAGNHRIAWDGSTSSGVRASTGIYLYRIQAEGFVESKKMVLLK